MKWFKKLNKEEQKEVFNFAKNFFLEGFKQSNYEFNNEIPSIPDYHLENETFISIEEIETVLDVEFKKYFLNSANELTRRIG